MNVHSNSDHCAKPDSEQMIKNMKASLLNVADAFAEQMYQESFSSIVTLADCVQYYRNEKKSLSGSPSAAGFALSVKKNYDPRNDNDHFIVVQGLVDAHNKPIVRNGETVSRILHTKTIDDALIRALDGKESSIFKV